MKTQSIYTFSELEAIKALVKEFGIELPEGRHARLVSSHGDLLTAVTIQVEDGYIKCYRCQKKPIRPPGQLCGDCLVDLLDP